jgi:hypothetical protein
VDTLDRPKAPIREGAEGIKPLRYERKRALSGFF